MAEADRRGRLRRLLDRYGRGMLGRLTVLAPKVDPFRQDTDAGHRDGSWFAAFVERVGLHGRMIHLRGVHYAARDEEQLLKPDGTLYLGTDEEWEWLQGTAAKAARWLGYSDWEQFLDKRNDAPIAAPFDEEEPEPEPYLDATVAPDIPETVDLVVEVPELVGFEGRQAYHLVLIGEKSSLEPVLAPIARRFNAHLYLPTGEISDTLIYRMARDAAEDGRRMIVFYFNDADPSGWQMCVSVARKLQAFKVGWFPDLDFEMRRVALTPKQVHELGLRLTPLKEGEKRREAWAAHMDLWAVDDHGDRVPGGAEIDALTIPKREAAFRQIVIDAVAPFFDDTLADRTRETIAEWRREVENLVDEQIDRTAWDAAKADAEERLRAIRDEIDAINAALADAKPAIDFPEIVLPEPVLDVKPNGSPLIDSDWSFADQTTRLIAEKRYE